MSSTMLQQPAARPPPPSSTQTKPIIAPPPPPSATSPYPTAHPQPRPARHHPRIAPITPIARTVSDPIAITRTSSLREPLPGESRSPTPDSEDETGERDDFLAHQTRTRRSRRVKGDFEDDGMESPNPRGDKRRRVNKQGRNSDTVLPSPSRTHHSYPSPSPTSPHVFTSGRFTGLAPIKPMGFAASRGSRREDGDLAIPSPVVMGFDFKSIDDEQLRTVGLTDKNQEHKTQAEAIRDQVRDTISIKEQQQALIAQRRRENAASTPSTPKELTFKGWVPKEVGSAEKQSGAPQTAQQQDVIQPQTATAAGPAPGGGVGRRREKTRDKVEGMSIVTGASDKDGIPGSKSAPLNQGLSAQQASPHDHIGGAQTSVPHAPAHHHAYNSDLRTAPISHARGSRDDHEFARQQQGSAGYWRSHPRGYDRYDQVPQTARPSITVPTGPLQPPSSIAREQPSPNVPPPIRNGHGRYDSHSPSSPPPLSATRHTAYGGTGEYYDMYSKVEQLKYSLQDLHHRYEGLYSSQVHAMGDFKNTASQANSLLASLQASADSLKEMVRYEVGRAGSAEKKELDELRDKVKALEDKMAGRAGKGKKAE